MRRLAFVLLLAAACSSGDDDGVAPARDAGTPPVQALVYTPCTDNTRVGAIVVDVRDQFTTVQGSYEDGVRPTAIPDVVQTVGTCELLQPPTLFCDPPCAGGMTCGAEGCVPLPAAQDVGVVTIEGLSAPVEMTSRPPVYFYNFIGDLPHPGFMEGDEVRLTADGFSLRTLGVAPLDVTTATLAIDRDAPAVVEWTAATADPAIRLTLELNIANHGGTPGRIVCTAEDTGRFEIPAALVTALLDFGFSGFPTVRISREGVASTDMALGCAELRTRSQVLVPVDIPGLVSCSNSDECPAGQTCQPDLTCQ